MKTFRATELKQSIGQVLIAAAQAPVYITKHQVPCYVLMTIEAYQAIYTAFLEKKKNQFAKCEDSQEKDVEGVRIEKLETAW